jgi:hypothetical protein
MLLVKREKDLYPGYKHSLKMKCPFLNCDHSFEGKSAMTTHIKFKHNASDFVSPPLFPTPFPAELSAPSGPLLPTELSAPSGPSASSEPSVPKQSKDSELSSREEEKEDESSREEEEEENVNIPDSPFAILNSIGNSIQRKT